MPDPLPGDKNWQLYMEFNLSHLEWCSVMVLHQVVNQTAIFIAASRAASIRYASSLYDRGIVTHIIHNSDETMVKYRYDLVEQFF